MKTILVLSIALVACEQSKSPDAPVTSSTAAPPPKPTTESAPIATASALADPPKRPMAKEGELCGGIGGIQCAAGLSCKMIGKPYPDQAGTCSK